jgi:hypothetical protein
MWNRATCWSTRELDQYNCFLERSTAIGQRHGVEAVLPYATDVMFPRMGYWQLHMIMHTIGEMAYLQKNDIFATLALLQPYEDYTREPEFLGGFDGFVHGAVTSYFGDVADARSYPERMRYICEGSEIQNITTNVHGCYHTLGHALMYANGNSVDAAIQLCKSAPSKIAQDACYYGVFMEDSFLFWPEYHVGIPRPDAEGSSLAPVCDRYDGSIAFECRKFIGQTYISLRFIGTTRPAEAGDMIAAVNECERFSPDNPGCMSRLAALYLPPYVGGLATPERVCALTFPEPHRDLCVEALNDGLRRGFGVREKEKSPPWQRAITILRAAFE